MLATMHGTCICELMHRVPYDISNIPPVMIALTLASCRDVQPLNPSLDPRPERPASRCNVKSDFLWAALPILAAKRFQLLAARSPSMPSVLTLSDQVSGTHFPKFSFFWFCARKYRISTTDFARNNAKHFSKTNSVYYCLFPFPGATSHSNFKSTNCGQNCLQTGFAPDCP